MFLVTVYCGADREGGRGPQWVVLVASMETVTLPRTEEASVCTRPHRSHQVPMTCFLISRDQHPLSPPSIYPIIIILWYSWREIWTDQINQGQTECEVISASYRKLWLVEDYRVLLTLTTLCYIALAVQLLHKHKQYIVFTNQTFFCGQHQPKTPINISDHSLCTYKSIYLLLYLMQLQTSKVKH